MPRPSPLALAALLLAVLALAPGEASAQTAEPFSPDAVNWDALAETDYALHVGPLLHARGVFADAEGSAPASAEAYAWDALFEGPWGEAVVPFDPAGSLLVRLARDLPEGEPSPYPNVAALSPAEVRFLDRWIRSGARASDGRVPYADARHVLYACEQGQNSVALVDGDRLRVIRRVYLDALGLPGAPYGPHHVAFEPGGGAWYVSLVSAGVVAKLSTRLDLDPADPAYLLGRTPEGAIVTPGMLALDPLSGVLYVGRSTLAAEGTPGLAVVDRATMEAETVATPFDVPHGLALTPDGRFVVTASLTGGVVAVYDAATRELVAQHRVGGGPRELVHLSVLSTAPATPGPAAGGHTGHSAGHGGPAARPAATPGGYEVSLTSRTTDEVLFFRLGLDGALAPLGAVPTGRGPWHAHLAADGRTLLVPNRDGGSVTLVDARTRSVLGTLAPAGPNSPVALPHTPVPGPDGTRFFVSSSNLRGTWTPPLRFLGPPGPDGVRALEGPERQGNLAVLSASGEVIKTIPLGFYPSGVETDHHAHTP